jgi:DNA-binding response OmpR family regulator
VDTNLTIAQDGEQALTHLRGSQFNLVILDLNLPRRDGKPYYDYAPQRMDRLPLSSSVVLRVRQIEN